ncbi:MAG: DUF2095 family protein [Candidatus Nezhaarchaeota archaeon]|nr:DUF2095 family protein [Candidatus Nezhaarchaeota archaeon]
MIEYDLDEFRKKYPRIVKELEEGTCVKSLFELIEGTEPPSMPTVIDYLRRCGTIREAKEVLEYLLRTGQLRKEEKEILEGILNSEGLEPLGPRKEFGYYSKKYVKNVKRS